MVQSQKQLFPVAAARLAASRLAQVEKSAIGRMFRRSRLGNRLAAWPEYMYQGQSHRTHGLTLAPARWEVTINGAEAGTGDNGNCNWRLEQWDRKHPPSNLPWKHGITMRALQRMRAHLMRVDEMEKATKLNCGVSRDPSMYRPVLTCQTGRRQWQVTSASMQRSAAAVVFGSDHCSLGMQIACRFLA